MKIKKLLSIILTIMLIISVCPLGLFSITASAATSYTSGYYTYTVSDGGATITDVDTSISGDVTIPSTLGGYPVTDIGKDAFSGCTNLTSVTIPDSVTSIGYYAFNSCTNLNKVNITDIAAWCNIDFSSYYSNPLYYAHNLYLNGELVTDLVIPNTVTKIKDYAFYGCTSLTSITIPDSVTIIGSSAFYNCKNLTSVTIPDSVTSIGSSAFGACNKLESITLPFVGGSATENTRLRYIFYNIPNSLKTVILSNKCTSIPEEAFYNCTSLTSITIPDSVTSIGSYAFEGCTNLTKVNITDIAAWCNIDFYILRDYSSNPLDYAHNLYLNGELVTDLVIPDTVTTIKPCAFQYCTSLTSVTIPDSVTSMGYNVFDDYLKDIYYSGSKEEMLNLVEYNGDYNRFRHSGWYDKTWHLGYTGQKDEFVLDYYLGEYSYKDKTLGWWYRYTDGSYATGWKNIDGKWYYFNQSGYMMTGWQLISESWYYFDASGVMVTDDWVGNYYLSKSGVMTTPSWQLDANGWWFDYGNGTYATGWAKIKGTWYYFNASGYMQTGWQWINGLWYYFNSSGAMVTNTYIDGYYLSPSGYMATPHWEQNSTGWWYNYGDGSYALGWKEINGAWYYFDQSGYMVTSTWVGGYYLSVSGAMTTPTWQQDANGWWYSYNDGNYAVGFEYIGGKWYYFNQSGYMQTGWQQIANDKYYFYQNGSMAANCYVDGCYLTASGAMA